MSAPDIDGFLATTAWAGAEREALPGDASARRYERLYRDGGSALLLIQPMSEGRSAYADAARLADDDPLAVAAITQQLVQRGFSAPAVIASDLDQGLILLEDLGDELFARVLEHSPSREAELYGKAVDVLAAIYRSSFPAEMDYRGGVWRVGDYDADVLVAEANLLLDWYAPARDIAHDAGAREGWEAGWREAFKALAAHAPGLVLRDFHAENVFALDRDFEASVGLIDFQDALFGHPAYDLVSLLQDARRDVDADVEAQCIGRFCHRARLPHNDDFRAAYHVLGAQRAAKILGIFVRLAERDGKERYLDFLPRVEGQFRRNLEHPALAPVRVWWEMHS